MIDPTSAGISNGIDVQGLVKKLVAAEGDPIKMRLDRKEATIQTQLSSLGTFKSALADFQGSTTKLRDADTLQSVKASSSDEDVLAVSAKPGAQQGKFNIEVTQMAQAQRLASDAYDSDTLSIGTGKLTFQFGSVDPKTKAFTPDGSQLPHTITVDENNSNLKGVQRLINKADFGVQASIINDGVGHRLVLTSKLTGENRAIRIKVDDDDGQNKDVFGLSSLAFDPAGTLNKGNNLSVTSEAQNAHLVIDGIDVESPTNQVSNVINGVNLDIKQLTKDKPVEVKTAFDRAGVTESIKGFVSAYNALLKNIDDLTGYDPKSGKSGPLSGDASIRGVASQIRRLLGTDFSSVNQKYTSLSAIGIDTDRDGHLSLNEGQLQKAVDDNLDEVLHMFSRYGNTTDPLTQFVGASDASKTGRFSLVVNAKPTQGYYRAALPIQFPITVDDKDNAFQLVVDGTKTKPIHIKSGSYSNADELVKQIQFQLNSDANLVQKNLAATVSIENGQLVFESNAYGSHSRVDVTSASPLLLLSMGLINGNGEAGKNIQASLGGRQAQGSGWKVKGDGDAAGVEVDVLGGNKGARGDVIFSLGVAEQLHKLIDSYLSNKGILDTRFDGYNKRIEDINTQRDKLQRRLATSKQRYLKQYTALDEMVGKMKSTGKYLTNQLANLPGAAKPGK